MTSRSYFLNGIRINDLKISSLQPELERLFSCSGRCTQLITLNTHFLRNSYSDEIFRDICRTGDIVLADGMGIVFLIRLKYGTWIERVTGSDLFKASFEFARRRSLRVALVGSTPDTLSKLSAKIRSGWPSVNFMTISPENNFEYNTELNRRVLQELKDYDPDILLMALGCPRQEKWIYSNKDFAGAWLNIGVGAVFDFYSGTKRRAPVFIQEIGMEWFWRLLQEPGRLGKRYLLEDIPFFIKSVVKIILRRDEI